MAVPTIQVSLDFAVATIRVLRALSKPKSGPSTTCAAADPAHHGETHFLRPFLVRAPVSVVRSQETGKEITYEKGIHQHQARERRADDLLEDTIDVLG